MEEKIKFNRLKKSNGITLIALVVTIIVLIILAGVSINLILGDNGIITKAQEAKQVQEKAEIKSEIQLELMAKEAEVLQNGNALTVAQIEEILEKYGTVNKEGEEIKSLTPTGKDYAIPYEEIYSGKTKEPTGEEKAVVGEIVTGKNKPYTNNGTAVIPVGFAIVPGLDDVSAGLVISDKANDIANEGNQFVWIPVDKGTFDTKFKRTEGYCEGELDSYLSNCGEADGTGVNSYLEGEDMEEDSSVQQEAIAMYTSVEENGGFYIGRYEAGTTATTGTGIRGELVVKKGANVYNYIGWSDSDDMTDVTGGAVELARGLYAGKKTATNENYGVVSTLCYGVQWDAALNFIDPNYITNEVEIDGELQPNCAEDSYVVDSSGKGWYMDNYSTGNPNQLTGIDVDSEASNKVKNIYDMAGNVYEWTMESYSWYCRVSRGRFLQRFRL